MVCQRLEGELGFVCPPGQTFPLLQLLIVLVRVFVPQGSPIEAYSQP